MRDKNIYGNLPKSQRNLMTHFLVAHPQKSLKIDGVTWQYYDSENDAPVLLLLHGGFADYSMWIHQITAFQDMFRIIAPTCPPLPQPTMQVYAKALKEILDAEKVERLNLIGYSEGGLIAQVFIRENRHQVDKAILAHTFYPSPENKYYRYNFNLFRILPSFLTTWIFRAFAQPDKEESEANTDWQAWFQAYFKSLKVSLNKPIIITHIDLMIDFARNYQFHSDDLQDWNGKMLLTVSADDIVFDYFEGMQRLYPMASSHIFESGLGAHSIALICPEVFNQRIGEFLQS